MALPAAIWEEQHTALADRERDGEGRRVGAGEGVGAGLGLPRRRGERAGSLGDGSGSPSPPPPPPARHSPARQLPELLLLPPECGPRPSPPLRRRPRSTGGLRWAPRHRGERAEGGPGPLPAALPPRPAPRERGCGGPRVGRGRSQESTLHPFRPYSDGGWGRNAERGFFSCQTQRSVCTPPGAPCRSGLTPAAGLRRAPGVTSPRLAPP